MAVSPVTQISQGLGNQAHVAVVVPGFVFQDTEKGAGRPRPHVEHQKLPAITGIVLRRRKSKAVDAPLPTLRNMI